MARSAGRNFVGVVLTTGGDDHWVALVRGPGGSVSLGNGSGKSQMQKVADGAATKLNSGSCQKEWDKAIDAMEYAEVVQTSVIGQMKVNAGIPTTSPYGRYIKARAKLRKALGLPEQR
jgi:hypothetical protein